MVCLYESEVNSSVANYNLRNIKLSELKHFVISYRILYKLIMKAYKEFTGGSNDRAQ